jgi:hypothetical protein
MELDRIGNAPRPPFTGAFHDYVLSVFLEQAARSRALLSRARRLHRFGQRPTSDAEQRWEGEGGSTG